MSYCSSIIEHTIKHKKRYFLMTLWLAILIIGIIFVCVSDDHVLLQDMGILILVSDFFVAVSLISFYYIFPENKLSKCCWEEEEYQTYEDI